MGMKRDWMSSAVVPAGMVAAGFLLAVTASAGVQGILPSNPPYPGTAPTKAADRTTVAPGGVITWTITISNDFFKDPATVSISDDVPDPADYPTATLPFNTGTDLILPPGATATYNGDIVSVSNVNVDGLKSAVVTVRTRISPTAPDGTVICNQAFVRHVIDTCMGFPEICGTVTYDTGSRPPGASASAKTCVTVGAPKPIDVQADAIPTPYADSCADPNFPAPDGKLSPGETVKIKLPIKNLGGTNSTGTPTITGTLSAGSGFTIVGAASSPYATTGTPNTLLANGANAGTNSNDFVLRIDPNLTCPATLSLSLVVSNLTGGPFTIPFSVPVTECQPRCLLIALSAVAPTASDACTFGNPPGGNGQIDPGESVSLSLPVKNTGPDDLKGAPQITGTISITPPVSGVTVVNAQAGYADLLANTTQINATPDFKIQVADTVPCGTAFTVHLILDQTNGAGTRTVDYPLTVATSCTVCKTTAVCASEAFAVAAGPTRLCPTETVKLDASTSTLKNCLGVPSYQWYQASTKLVGETKDNYLVPGTLAAGSYQFSVELACSSDPNCIARSAPVDVLVDPVPLIVKGLLARKMGVDIQFSWSKELTATGGYHGYSTTRKQEIPSSHLVSPGPNVKPVFQTAPDPNVLTATLVNAVPPVPDPLLFYQTVSTCSNGTAEGPN